MSQKTSLSRKDALCIYVLLLLGAPLQTLGAPIPLFMFNYSGNDNKDSVDKIVKKPMYFELR